MSGGSEGLDKYQKGGFYRVDDITGARVRARDTREQWDGAITHKEDWSPRHPQEFLRSKRDDQSVPKARPVQSIVSSGPDDTVTTADAAAGATSIEVSSSTGFHSGGRVAIMLDNNDCFLGTITGLSDSTHIEFTPALPFAASSGAVVVDYTVTTPTF